MISIVIPTLNEAAQLPATLAALRPQAPPYEVVVVDARSTDDTARIAGQQGASVLQVESRQRAAQMNAGAQATSGEYLLFLHADTRLPATGLARILGAFGHPSVVGGGFARQYDSPSPFLRLTCALAEARTRCFGWFLGDQAMFVRRSVFTELGGFRAWDAFEDLDFARRLARAGRVVTLRPPVISAGRRFAARGSLRTTVGDLWLTARYLSSGGPEERSPSPGAGRLPASVTVAP